MCYNAFTEKAHTAQIADKDIKVYKICTATKHTVVSYYYKYIYVPLETTYKIGITFAKENDLNFAVGGYHSYKSCKWYSCSRSKYIYAIIEDTYKAFPIEKCPIIADFIIPKGAIYYENSNGEILSNQIMFTGIIHKPIIHKDGSVESVKIDLNEENRTVSTEISE